MSGLINVKSHVGMSYVRPEKVIAVQIPPTGGGCVIVLEGGMTVHSVESATTVAGRLKAKSK